eukprot:TRINITY_DN4102_c0_g1_i5.p1 TRINITY_DN4102_c0_g1~~TRINITY_DN4102_c0_g1_i5.p1  ORF type:complete len:1169 (-),score=280.29 TRINITY_DN4102_c0_g1_i5:33-3539(-)
MVKDLKVTATPPFDFKLTKFPMDITALLTLQILQLDRHDFGVIPPQISQLAHLKELHLSHNNIKTMPELKSMIGLVHLNVSNNRLVSFPNIAFNVNLQILQLQRNQLSSLPTGLSELTKLTTLLAQHNRVSMMPDISNNINLEKVDLSFNQISSLSWKPLSIKDNSNMESVFSNLTSLNVSQNKLGGIITSQIELMSNLRELNLSNNLITGIPKEIGVLDKLLTLDLNGNQLSALPPEFAGCTSLQSLDLSRNKIVSLYSQNEAASPILVHLRNLTFLNLHSNQLVEAKSISLLPSSVVHLDFSNNQLTSIPSSLHLLTLLTRLELSFNQITSLPDELFLMEDPSTSLEEFEKVEIGLKKLEYLNIANNQLKSIPFSISNLSNLRDLDISENTLMNVPSCLIKLESLKTLWLHSKKLACIPSQLPSSLEILSLGSMVIDRPRNEIRLIHHLPSSTSVPLSSSSRARTANTTSTPTKNAAIEPQSELNAVNFDKADSSLLCSQVITLLNCARISCLYASRNNILRNESLGNIDISSATEKQLEEKVRPVSPQIMSPHIERSSPNPKEKIRTDENSESSISESSDEEIIEERIDEDDILLSKNEETAEEPRGELSPIIIFGLLYCSTNATLRSILLENNATEDFYKLLIIYKEDIEIKLNLILILSNLYRHSSSPNGSGDEFYSKSGISVVLSEAAFSMESLNDSDTHELRWNITIQSIRCLSNLGMYSNSLRKRVVNDFGISFVTNLHTNHMGFVENQKKKLNLRSSSAELLSAVPNQRHSPPESPSLFHHRNASVRELSSQDLKLMKREINKLLNVFGAHSFLHFPSSRNGKGVRILTMDGGGTRALVTLEILKRIEMITGRRICSMFDIIAGTSTGGILASLVAIRGYSLDDCERLYKDLASKIFTIGNNTESKSEPSSWSKLINYTQLLKSGAFYKTKPLAEAFAHYCGSESMIDTTKDDRMKRVKVFMASTLVSTTPPQTYLFRNYNYPVESSPRYLGDCRTSLSNALRASTAAPSYFEEYEVGLDRFQDGAIVANNPAAVAIHEAKCLFGEKVTIDCLLSLGTGTPPKKVQLKTGFLQGTLSTLVKAATSAEKIHYILEDLLSGDDSPIHYCRLNPIGDAFNCELDETSESKFTEMQLATRDYLDQNQEKLIKLCQILKDPLIE